MKKQDLSKLEDYLYQRVKAVITSWRGEDISDAYAVSFFVYSNECHIYRGKSNVTEFSVGYITERDCERAPELSEERWDFPPLMDNTPILQPDNEAVESSGYRDEGMDFLFDWYAQNGVENVGFESDDEDYDSEGCYIGKGPDGFREVWVAAANVARRLQEEGVIRQIFGFALPVIVHQMEMYDEIRDKTAYANPNGEAEAFLKFYDQSMDMDQGDNAQTDDNEIYDQLMLGLNEFVNDGLLSELINAGVPGEEAEAILKDSKESVRGFIDNG